MAEQTSKQETLLNGLRRDLYLISTFNALQKLTHEARQDMIILTLELRIPQSRLSQRVR